MTDTLSLIREVMSDLREVDHIAYRSAKDLAPVEKDLTRARLKARARVLDDTPKMRLPDVDMYVELDPEVDRLRDLHIGLSWKLKAAKESAHSLRQILSAYQSTGRIEADLSR